METGVCFESPLNRRLGRGCFALKVKILEPMKTGAEAAFFARTARKRRPDTGVSGGAVLLAPVTGARFLSAR